MMDKGLRRRTVVAVVLIISLISFASCERMGNGGNEPTERPTPVPTPSATIVARIGKPDLKTKPTSRTTEYSFNEVGNLGDPLQEERWYDFVYTHEETSRSVRLYDPYGIVPQERYIGPVRVHGYRMSSYEVQLCKLEIYGTDLEIHTPLESCIPLKRF